VACRRLAAVEVRTSRRQSVSGAELAEVLRRVEGTLRTLQQDHQELRAQIEQLRSNTNGFEADELNPDALPWTRLAREIAEVKGEVEQLRRSVGGSKGPGIETFVHSPKGNVTAIVPQPDPDIGRKLNMSLAELELSVRATNSLESEGITTVRDLVIRTDDELLEVRNFGETTLKEVKAKLAERGLRLGMKLPPS
jgi:hypothetical protein